MRNIRWRVKEEQPNVSLWPQHAHMYTQRQTHKHSRFSL